jgi:hypothetical protein
VTYLVNSLTSRAKYGVLTVMEYQLYIFIIKVGQADSTSEIIITAIKESSSWRIVRRSVEVDYVIYIQHCVDELSNCVNLGSLLVIQNSDSWLDAAMSRGI